jgi:hypothetical protein
VPSAAHAYIRRCAGLLAASSRAAHPVCLLAPAASPVLAYLPRLRLSIGPVRD